MNIYGYYITGFVLLLVVLVIIIWLVIPLLIAKAAKERGRSFAGFFLLSVLFSPLIGGLILLLLGKNEEEIKRKGLESGLSKICPYCANVINYNAKICMFCHTELMEKDKIDEIIKKDNFVKNNFDNPYIVLSDTILKMQPDVNANEITDLKCDDIVDFLSEAYEDTSINNIWYKIKHNNLVGWCLKTSIKKYSVEI